MSPRTTEPGVLDALAIAQRFFLSLEPEEPPRSGSVFQAAFEAVNDLTLCALSHDVRLQLSNIIQTTAFRYDALVNLLNVQRLEAENKERELEAALEKERRAQERASEQARARKVGVVAFSYVVFGCVPAYWGDYRLAALLAVPAFLHYLLLGDSRPARWLRDLLHMN